MSVKSLRKTFLLYCEGAVLDLLYLAFVNVLQCMKSYNKVSIAVIVRFNTVPPLDSKRI
jgi:hypothetical protein